MTNEERIDRVSEWLADLAGDAENLELFDDDSDHMLFLARNETTRADADEADMELVAAMEDEAWWGANGYAIFDAALAKLDPSLMWQDNGGVRRAVRARDKN